MCSRPPLSQLLLQAKSSDLVKQVQQKHTPPANKATETHKARARNHLLALSLLIAQKPL